MFSRAALPAWYQFIQIHSDLRSPPNIICLQTLVREKATNLKLSYFARSFKLNLIQIALQRTWLFGEFWVREIYNTTHLSPRFEN